MVCLLSREPAISSFSRTVGGGAGGEPENNRASWEQRSEQTEPQRDKIEKCEVCQGKRWTVCMEGYCRPWEQSTEAWAPLPASKPHLLSVGELPLLYIHLEHQWGVGCSPYPGILAVHDLSFNGTAITGPPPVSTSEMSQVSQASTLIPGKPKDPLARHAF